MPISNYPSGFAHGVSIRGLPLLSQYGGNVWWVDSVNGSNANAGTHNRPFATLAQAVTAATASNGDIVMVKAGHAETISAAGGIALSKAGMAFIGLGVGSQRPTISIGTATSATMTVTAANVTIKNFIFSATFADVVAALDVTGTNFTAEDCVFQDSAADLNMKSAITCSGAAGTANGLYVARNRFNSADAATLGFILTTDDVTDATIIDNVVISEGTGLATLITNATGKDMKRVFVARNFLSAKATAGALFISNDTASPNNSGIIAHNRVGHADVTGAHSMGAVGGCRFFDNLSVSTDALSGFVLPAIDVDL